MHLTLDALGWTPFFAAQVAPDEDRLTPARVVAEHKNSVIVRTATHEMVAVIAGRIFHEARSRLDLPNVGDFVLCKVNLQEHKAAVQRTLERKTILTRTEERTGQPQVLAANVDYAFLATSLNQNFNVRRLERYLAMAKSNGVDPVIVLTKADLVDPAEAAAAIDAVRAAAPGVAIHAISCLSKTGLDEISAYLPTGRTAVVLGSSGVGKSTLVNYLAEADIQDMMDIRAFDDKGRHCTTSRHLIHLPSGGMIIDTPGLRGLAIADADEGIAATFDDLDALATACKFTNCQHATEPGCALRAAVEAGTVPSDRLEAYLRLTRETDALTRKANALAISKERKRIKRQTQDLNKWLKHKRPW